MSLLSRFRREPHEHPLLKTRQKTVAEKASDRLTLMVGSWSFIFSLLFFLGVWMLINSFGSRSWDPYPYILLNFFLSTIAALQAPVIMMSQNRQAERDRLTAKYDYEVNRRVEREVLRVDQKLDKLKHQLDRHRSLIVGIFPGANNGNGTTKKAPANIQAVAQKTATKKATARKKAVARKTVKTKAVAQKTAKKKSISRKSSPKKKHY
ncbi:MAG: DUF1003 domain-containing protein [Candidatus Woesearchaeota archaeon]|nr:MAG: DUF1003 domain-containing protein [Candidatus Woesearchaeota archaeon]